MSSEMESSDIHSEEERLHFYKIISSFKSYRVFNKTVFMKRLKYLSTLPEEEQKLLMKYRKRVEDALKCIDHNHSIIKMIIQDVEVMFENIEHKPLPGQKEWKRLTNQDLDKVNITLKQIYRDWSKEGAVERVKCYDPILKQIEEHFPATSCDRTKCKILVPGAGLGRLAFEIAKLGFISEGNEFSFFMLMAANFILNKCTGVDLHEVYPWVHHIDNIFRSDDQFKKISFPDCDPSDIKTLWGPSRFSMSAGDFTEVYTSANEWDCVATCFFIDCATNIHRFIQQIYKILKPGGIWVNFGPLQYHFSAMLNEDSIEPSYEEIREIITAIGFIIQKEETGITTTYSQHQESMMKHVYECVFLSCVKPKESLSS